MATHLLCWSSRLLRAGAPSLWTSPEICVASASHLIHQKRYVPQCIPSRNLRLEWPRSKKVSELHTLASCSRIPYPFLVQTSHRSVATKSGPSDPNETGPPDEKPNLLTRFKDMYKQYWYVLVPVHCVTSVFWFGSFYYLAKTGFDIVPLLEYIGLPEKVIDPLRDSAAGHLAVMFALYKLATPARYIVTLGGTTISIKYLEQWGYIKPIPSKEKLKEMYEERKENLKEAYREKKEEFRQSLKNKNDT